MNAVGTYVPPVTIWPRKNMKAEMMNVAPGSSVAACYPSVRKQIFLTRGLIIL
jgi:hypothetical protein